MTLRKDLTIIRGCIGGGKNWAQERFLRQVAIFDEHEYTIVFDEIVPMNQADWNRLKAVLGYEPVHCDWNFADDEI